jgi:hypothetical protein
MISSARLTVLGLLFFACAPSNTEKESNTAAEARAATFVYAPMLNRPHRETMRRSEEFSIPGSPLRNLEEWVMDWDVVLHQETNLLRRSMTLVGLKINVNGAETLRGDEVKASAVTLEVLTDKDSNVVDVRGTEQFSAAIVALGAAESQQPQPVAPTPAVVTAAPASSPPAAATADHPTGVVLADTKSQQDALGAADFAAVPQQEQQAR